MKKCFLKKVLASILSSAMIASAVPQTNLATISAAKKNVGLNTTFKTLKVGKSYKLKLKNNSINWKIQKVSTTNKRICTVYKKKSTSVLLKGKNEGRATIKIKVKTSKRRTFNKKTLKCRVKVVPRKFTPAPEPQPDPVPEPITTYSITFNTNGGSYISGQSVESGKIIIKPNDPVRQDYVFKGWYSDINLENVYDFSSAVTGNITLYAKWNNTYTVKFQTNGGNTIEDQIIENGEKVTKPNDPTRSRSIFLRWFSDGQLKEKYDFLSTVTKDMTIYARWQVENDYQPNWGYTGGNNTSGSSGNNHVTPIKYTVKFDSNGGSIVPAQTVESKNNVIQPANPTKEGYIFDGWYIDKELTIAYDFNTATKENMTLYAKWNAIVQKKYTVKFNTNGGSVVDDQIIEKDSLVKQPDPPTRSGYTFEGWYTSASDGEKFNFNSVITGDITLYARWIVAVPDNVVDQESTEVTENDKYDLSASTKEIVAESSEDVTFYVNSTLTVSSFELYCNDKSTGVLLFDDGDYDSHRDDIPNDGCYTGHYTIDLAIEDDIEFTAKTTVGSEKITTDPYSIFVYYEITDEDTEKMNAVDDEINKIILDKKSGYSENKKNEESIKETHDAVNTYLCQLVNAGTITNLQYEEELYAFSWTYCDTDIDTMHFIYGDINEDVKGKELGKATDENTRQKGDNLNRVQIPKVSSSDEIDMNISQGKVVILNYYEQGHSWSNNYDKISKKLTTSGFDVTNIYDFTCADFMHLQEYNSLILLNSHGDTSNGKQSGTPMICTQESQTNEKNKKYSSDIKRKRIKKVTLADNSKVYWIYPELFNFYYAEDQLSSPIVNLGCCRNFPNSNNTMVNAINKAGASSVCGYSASVSTSYDYDMSSTMVDRLLYGDTINKAIIYAKAENGLEDQLQDEGWKINAVLNYYGNSNATLYHELKNGNFDNLVSLWKNLSSWQTYGDARGIYRLSGILPKSFPRMAIISSGFGSLNDETTSCIYQTFLVPENATQLSFSYDVVSEEPMEYVGTIFDDIFKVEILNTKGDVLENLVYESVNTSTWYSVEGIDFPNGDETTYHTRWKDFSSDVISKYRGQLIALRFLVSDSGDAIYDTAALIDSVAVN